ncbi:MAG: GLPGLI family protein [Bacteroidia bacterium]|nr:GLPGLI family protein [Bacteroidia bacterium]
MNSVKKITCACCLLLCTTLLSAQLVITQQTIDRMSGNLPQEQLDKGIYRCIYHFTQQIKESKTGNTLLQTDTMALDFGKNFSVYYDWNKARIDSVQRGKIKKLEITSIRQKTNPNFDMVEYQGVQGSYFVNTHKGENSEVFKNRLKNEVVSIDITDLESFKCTEQLSPQHWQFTADTLSVLGYVCQKAITSFRGRDYHAWFAVEIPIKEGPWKLYGLPGLILKATTNDGLFAFEAIGLENLKDVYIAMDKDTYSNCTRKEFAKYKSNKRKKLLARHYINGTITVGSTKNPFEFNDLELE